MSLSTMLQDRHLKLQRPKNIKELDWCDFTTCFFPHPLFALTPTPTSTLNATQGVGMTTTPSLPQIMWIVASYSKI